MRAGSYKAILVPPCDLMPWATLKNLLALAGAGIPVIFESHLPSDVPGLSDLARRRRQFKTGLKLLEGWRSHSILTRRVWVCDDLEALEGVLSEADVKREKMTDAGLFFLRRAFDGGHSYFIVNRSGKSFEGWLPLAGAAKSVVTMDALSGQAGVAATRQSAANSTEVYLQLQAGESVILRVFEERKVNDPPWTYRREMFPATKLAGEWRVDFISGGPVLPASFATTNLASWAETGDTNAQNFAGTARYSIKFDAPSSEFRLQAARVNAELQTYFLDLGKVCQSARVKLNGKDYGTLIALPFRVVVNNLKPKDNLLEVEVTNVSANRIRDLDRRGVAWKIFNDINFVNINYKPFDASNWPLTDSGLLGPVTLTAVTEFQPAP